MKKDLFKSKEDDTIEIEEYCPYCEGEAILKNKFEIQKCSECGKQLMPCSVCEYTIKRDTCKGCPLE